MRVVLIALLGLSIAARIAPAQLVAAPDASPLGNWRGTSRCVIRNSSCNDEVVVYHIALKGARDSVTVEGKKIVDGREADMGTLACQLNAARAYVTCTTPTQKWRFGVRHDSLTGQLRLRDGTWIRDVHAVRPQ